MLADGTPVIDCLLYCGEREALAIRLHELEGLVDLHVIVEARTTFQGDPKPLHLATDLARYPELDTGRFADRLQRVIIERFGPRAHTSWDREAEQRDAVVHGLKAVPDDALVLLCDADEIPRAAAVRRYGAALGPDDVCRFGGPAYLYALNLRECTHAAWYGPHVVRRGHLRRERPQRIRGDGLGNTALPGSVPDAAWHFSFLGGADRVLAKLQAWSHTEDNHYATPEHVAEAMADLRDWKDDRAEPLSLRIVPLDDSYPAWVRTRPDLFRPPLVVPYITPEDVRAVYELAAEEVEG